MINRSFLSIFCALTLVALQLGVGAVAASAGQAPESSAHRQLVVLNWADYLDPELIAEFEAEFKVTVSEVYFETDQVRDKLMAQDDGKGYDLVLVDGASMSSYRASGWLVPLDQPSMPNLRHIEPRWAGAYEAAVGYGVPYFWGTLGIAYRSDLVAQAITSWRELYQPPEVLRGKIAMILDKRDLVGTALMALGYSPNSSDPKQLREAEAALMAQRPYVRNYSYVSLSEESALVKGDIWAAMMYSGDALVLQEYEENIVYVVPEEGAPLWIDYWTVPEASKNKELAMEFINFMNEPAHAARLAEFVYYPSPNLAAEQFLPEEFLADEQIYPSAATLARSVFYEELPPRAIRRLAMILAKLAHAN